MDESVYNAHPCYALPSFLPCFLETETLYSWGARFHILSGNTRATKTSRDLFSNSYAGLCPDFPFCLDSLGTNTGSLIGEPALIAHERTLLGYFVPFQPKQFIDEIVAQMAGASTTSLKSKLGRLSSGVGATYPLKACLKCIKSDLHNYGCSMWRIEHQWPSIWICSKHRCGLHALERRFQPRNLRKWWLPDQLPLEAWQKPVLPYGGAAKLTKLGAFTKEVIRRSMQLEPEILRQSYFAALEQRGWISTDGSIRFKTLRTAFHRYYSSLNCVPGLGSIAGAQCEHGGLLGLLTRRYGGTRHPVKHFLLLSFLFSEPAEFFSTYFRLQAQFNEVESGGSVHPINQIWKVELKRMVEQENMSVSEASRRIRVPLPQAIRYARSSGLKYAKRPRVLTPKLDQQLRELAVLTIAQN